MSQPLRSRDAAPRSHAHPILPPKIDAQTHLDVAQAYLELGLPDEAMFELSLVEGDPSVRRQTESLVARVRALRASTRRPTAAPVAGIPDQSPTRVDGLRARSTVVPTAAAGSDAAPNPEVDRAIDRAFDECFADIDEASTAPDDAPF